MAQRSIALLLNILALTILPAAQAAASGELMFGCWTRPACGKVCKLVCETRMLTVVGYGCECKDICVAGPSTPGCKHCAACCGECSCGGAGCDRCCQEHAPKCLFCWRDWCACGCAQPRAVKKLAKYQAEKEVCWYHWEVVDGCSCGCGSDGNEPGCGCVYKAAPADAQIGDMFELTDEERVQLVSAGVPANDTAQTLPAALPSTADHDQSKWRISNLFRLP